MYLAPTFLRRAFIGTEHSHPVVSGRRMCVRDRKPALPRTGPAPVGVHKYSFRDEEKTIGERFLSADGLFYALYRQDSRSGTF